MAEQQKTIPLYELVETAAEIVADLQNAINTNQDLSAYNTRRSDRRNANVRRIAKIWSEGQLTQVERQFDQVRDQPEKARADGAGKKKAQGGNRSGIEAAHSELMGIWAQLRKDPTFHHAKANARKEVVKATETVKKLEQEGKKLERMLGLTLDATRDLKQALANGIRNVPAEPALTPGANVPLAEKVAAMTRSCEAVNQRLTNSKQQPSPRPSPGPSSGGGGSHGDGGGDDGRQR